MSSIIPQVAVRIDKTPDASPFVDGDIASIVASLGNVADAFANRTIVIGGGCGFIGRYVAATIQRLNEGSLRGRRAFVAGADAAVGVSRVAVGQTYR